MKLLRDITIGRYIKSDSPLHRADPRTKTLSLLVFSTAVFMCDSLFSQLISLLFTVVSVRLAKIPFRQFVNGIKPLKWFLIFVFVMNIFNGNGNILFNQGILTITDSGIYNASLLTLRLILFASGAALFTLTTSPTSVADGFISLCTPLKFFHIPVEAVAMIISIMLRLIPVVTEEYGHISKAHKTRCLNRRNKGLINKIKSISACMVPLFINSFRHTDELALAMEARCYGSPDRKSANRLRFARVDMILSTIMVLFCIFLAIIEILH